jgi:hypothetical protein
MKTCASARSTPLARRLRRWRVAVMLALVLPGWGVACRSSKPPSSSILPEGWLPGQAQVTAAPGAGCRSKNPGASWRKLQPGDWLSAGATVEVRAPARLSLRLFEIGVMMEVEPGSLLRLDTLSYRREADKVVTSTVLTLTQGRVAVDSSHLSAGSEFEIRTPQGITRIPPQAAN